jgi:anti-anti-sigma factor
MARAGSSFFTVTDRRPPPWTRPEIGGPTIIWLRGEHDIATDGDLRRTLANAIALDNAPIVIDLSKVELMSASTLGIIIAAWNTLRQQSRSLTMRSPSSHVRRVINICGLQDLLSSEGRDKTGAVARKGLASLVDVPDDEHAGGRARAATVSEKRVPVHVGHAAAWREPGPDKMPT